MDKKLITNNRVELLRTTIAVSKQEPLASWNLYETKDSIRDEPNAMFIDGMKTNNTLVLFSDYSIAIYNVFKRTHWFVDFEEFKKFNDETSDLQDKSS